MSAPAFVYVAPARYEDILKLGFSYDPCDRVRSFHERYFEYFDLEGGFVLAATDEKDARRIERLLAESLADHRARAPLVIAEAAGGYTEWYRGALAAVVHAATTLVRDGGYEPLQSFAERMRQRLLLERELLFEHSTAMLDAIDALGDDAQGMTVGRRLRARLDAYTALKIEVMEHLPDTVRFWLDQQNAGTQACS
jgi:T5orf172 domain